MPKVSIIVPVYKTEPYLSRCMDSLLNQTLKDIEIVLVDDGSPDNCPKMCDEYAMQDTRVKVVHKKNGGLGLARNSGLDVASGDYVGFVDSDDFVELYRFKAMYKKAIEFDADACLEGNKEYDDGKIKRITHDKMNRLFEGTDIKNSLIPSILGSDAKGNDYVGMSVWRGIYRRSLIEQFHIRFYSEREYISEDVLFDMLFYSQAKRVYIARTTGYYYCMNPGSLTHTSNPRKYLLNDALHIKLRGILQEMDLPDVAFSRMDYTYIFNMKACIRNEVEAVRSIGVKTVLTHITDICNSPELIDTLKKYDSSSLPVHKKFFVYLLKAKRSRGLMQYMKIQ